MRNQRHSRPGFTIVEMMVATALVLVIMLIISQAFASASKTFRTIRAAGDMQAQLREGITTQRRDLAADHFGSPYGSARGGPRVSDQRLDQAGWQPPYRGYFEIRQLGDPIFGGPPSIREPMQANNGFGNTDGEGLTSTRAINHRMRFTVHLADAPGTDLFTAKFDRRFTTDPRVNAFVNDQDILYTRWAEISYLLEQMTDDASANGIANTQTNGLGLTRYTLRRRVRLLAPQNVDYYMAPQQALQIVLDCGTRFIDVIPPFIAGPAPDEVRAQQGQANWVTLRMPGPEALNGPDVDFTPQFINPQWPPVGVKRLKFPEEMRAPTDPPNPDSYHPEFRVHPTGDDILMVDVISMDIKAAWFNNESFNQTVATLYPPRPPLFLQPSPAAAPAVQPGVILPSIFAGGNMDEPFWDLPFSFLQPGNPLPPRWFDTGTHKLNPFPIIEPADWDYPGSFAAGQQIGNTQGFLTPAQQPSGPRSTTVPTRINLRALQIKLRVWNPRAEQARQVTFIVEV